MRYSLRFIVKFNVKSNVIRKVWLEDQLSSGKFNVYEYETFCEINENEKKNPRIAIVSFLKEEKTPHSAHNIFYSISAFSFI